jgi:hypothetical protein
VRAVGFPVRLAHADFALRFDHLAPSRTAAAAAAAAETVETAAAAAAAVAAMCEQLSDMGALKAGEWACGTSKVPLSVPLEYPFHFYY